MKVVHVDLEKQRYPITIGAGILSQADRLLSTVSELQGSPIVVSNRKVMRLHGPELLKSLHRVFDRIPVITIGDGERFKDHSTLLKIYEGMLRAGANRRSWILAFGGGVVGDIAGFAAATFMRGIPFVMAPTTLLAQVDSSIGGKVGINVKQGKNLIGAFHQPAAVLSDIEVLKTLPERELAAGIYEVIKCGAIRSAALICFLEQNLPEILHCSARDMENIVYHAARVKADVVARDEKESGLRMILNYGHTIGHALEAATGYRRFKHGEAVGWGMIASLQFGRQLGFLSSESVARMEHLIRRVRRLPSLRGISGSDLWKALVRDKKFGTGEIRMIFLRRLGEAEICSGIDPVKLRLFLKKFLEANG